jgi:hypothetical protein
MRPYKLIITAIAGLLVVLGGNQASADAVKEPLAGEKYFPLDGSHVKGIPLNRQTGQFYPLTKRNFRAWPYAKAAVPEKREQKIAIEPGKLHPASAQMMTDEQAKQIISLFAPGD